MKPLEPGAPLDLAEARNAVELARLAGADRYAADTFAKAPRLLTDAEVAREKRKRGNEVMMPARQAAQTAEDARLIALQRQEEEFQARAARASPRSASARRSIARRPSASAAQAERERAAPKRPAAPGGADAQNAAAARAAAERERLEIERRASGSAEGAGRRRAARAAAEAARLAAMRRPRQARAQAEQAQAAAAQAEQEKAALREQLREQLNVILETRETARGLIVNLSDVLFDTASATLKPGAREKLARVAGILASHPDLKIEIEGHTDSVGGDDYNQRLSERRAESVRTYLVQQRIAADRPSTLRGSARAARWRPTTRRPDGSRIAASSWSSLANRSDGPRPAVPPGSSALPARACTARAARVRPRRLAERTRAKPL